MSSLAVPNIIGKQHDITIYQSLALFQTVKTIFITLNSQVIAELLPTELYYLSTNISSENTFTFTFTLLINNITEQPSM